MITNELHIKKAAMTENNPIQVLMDEHEVISSVESIIQSLEKDWETDEGKYAEKIKQLLRFFREYSDNFHHHKEEEILFKELINNPDFLLDDIITELEEHHEMFRATVDEIQEAVDQKEWSKVQNLLKRYVNDLLDHIAVENDELFIMAESLFSEDELERMYFLFEDIDIELGKEHKQELAEGLNSI